MSAVHIGPPSLEVRPLEDVLGVDPLGQFDAVNTRETAKKVLAANYAPDDCVRLLDAVVDALHEICSLRRAPKNAFHVFGGASTLAYGLHVGLSTRDFVVTTDVDAWVHEDCDDWEPAEYEGVLSAVHRILQKYAIFTELAQDLPRAGARPPDASDDARTGTFAAHPVLIANLFRLSFVRLGTTSPRVRLSVIIMGEEEHLMEILFSEKERHTRTVLTKTTGGRLVKISSPADEFLVLAKLVDSCRAFDKTFAEVPEAETDGMEFTKRAIRARRAKFLLDALKKEAATSGVRFGSIFRRHFSNGPDDLDVGRTSKLRVLLRWFDEERALKTLLRDGAERCVVRNAFPVLPELLWRALWFLTSSETGVFTLAYDTSRRVMRVEDGRVRLYVVRTLRENVVKDTASGWVTDRGTVVDILERTARVRERNAVIRAFGPRNADGWIAVRPHVDDFFPDARPTFVSVDVRADPNDARDGELCIHAEEGRVLGRLPVRSAGTNTFRVTATGPDDLRTEWTIEPWPTSIEIVDRDDGVDILGITERTYALGVRAAENAQYDIVRTDDGAPALHCTLETRVWDSGPVDLFPTTPKHYPNVVDVFHANARALMALL